MGAFHDGHLALMRRAKQLAPEVWVSLFVNPTQFGPSEDFAAYPRDEARDLALAEGVGVDAVFAPSVEEMYASSDVSVRVSGVADLWEGAHRPGHFDGVATVVAKLFNIVQPEVAVFGLKDLQQCAVVRAMVAALDMPVKLDLFETVRDARGLALSSRNAYFNDEQRKDASALHRAIASAAARIATGEGSVSSLSAARENLENDGFEVEYLACVDPTTMQSADGSEDGLRVICAAKFHGVRLIDNVPV